MNKVTDEREALIERLVQAIRPYARETLSIDEHRDLIREALASAPVAVKVRDIETMAWECDKWPAWLHAIVDRTNETADRLDMSSEQAHAFAALSAIEPQDGWRVAPIAINFLIECAATDEPGVNIWPGGWDSDAGRSTREWLKSNGLVTDAYKLTERGQAWFEAILRTPLPTPPAGRAEG